MLQEVIIVRGGGWSGKGLYGIPDVHVRRRAMHLEKFIAPGSCGKGFLAWRHFCLRPTPLGPINTVHGGARRRQGMMDTWPQDVVVWTGRRSSQIKYLSSW